MFWNYIVMVAQLHQCSKHHWIVHFKRVIVWFVNLISVKKSVTIESSCSVRYKEQYACLHPCIPPTPEASSFWLILLEGTFLSVGYKACLPCTSWFISVWNYLFISCGRWGFIFPSSLCPLPSSPALLPPTIMYIFSHLSLTWLYHEFG